METVNRCLNPSPRVCKKCPEVYIPTSNRQEYCVACQRVLSNSRSKARHYRTYRKKGYNQGRDKNNAWKGGVSSYRYFIEKHKCDRCGSFKHLLVHHRDGIRTNNALENLEVLCKGCHQDHHCKRDRFGRFTAHK